MATKALKGVDEGVWNMFKAQAASRGVDMAEYLGIIVEEAQKQNAREWWNDLLSFIEAHKSSLTDSDVARMKAFRKRFRMRRNPDEIRP
ncbi:hypothetical protein HYV85_04290 [Candidatus Woesearchaeota archaeon]|nr:hypothetical protein [Candidatus Woesearchaeota archaeon]